MVALACRQLPAGAAPALHDGSYDATGVRSLDGDSIYVRLADGNQQEVRLIGIDAPEKSMPHANDARTFLRKTIANRKLWITPGTEAQDQFGRRLGWIEIDGKSLSAMMLEQGFAAAYVIPPNIDWTDQLLAAQRKAYEARRGIWGVRDMEEPRSFRYRKRNEGRGETHLLSHENHMLVGDVFTRVAHWPGCLHIGDIAAADRRLFDTVEDARAKGFRMERNSR